MAISLTLPLSPRTAAGQVQIDTARARQLYVSKNWEDHPVSNYEGAIEGKRITDSIYAAVTEGVAHGIIDDAVGFQVHQVRPFFRGGPGIIVGIFDIHRTPGEALGDEGHVVGTGQAGSTGPLG